MRTLHTSYRVTNLVASLDFYSALGYEQVGRVDLGDGASRTMLKFPEEEVVTLELAHRPADGRMDIGTGFSHLPIRVDDLSVMIAALSHAGLRPGPVEYPAGPDGPQASPRRMCTDRPPQAHAASPIQTAAAIETPQARGPPVLAALPQSVHLPIAAVQIPFGPSTLGSNTGLPKALTKDLTNSAGHVFQC